MTWKGRRALDHIVGVGIVPLGLMWRVTGHVGTTLVVSVIPT